MHEISLCEGILQLMDDRTAAQHYTCVDAVRLEIGIDELRKTEREVA